MKTFIEKVGLMADAMERKSRDNGDEFYCLKDGSPDWMRNVVHAVHGDKLPDDSTYQTIARVLDAINDEKAENEDEAREVVQEMEPTPYIHELTDWLSARADHVEYLTEAMKEFSPADGFALLTSANYLYIQEIGNSLISEIESTEVDE
jgi:hypothetical protein